MEKKDQLFIFLEFSLGLSQACIFNTETWLFKKNGRESERARERRKLVKKIGPESGSMDRDTRLAIIVQTRTALANQWPPFTWPRMCGYCTERDCGSVLKSMSGQTKACSITSNPARLFYTFIYFRGESFWGDVTF